MSDNIGRDRQEAVSDQEGAEGMTAPTDRIIASDGLQQVDLSMLNNSVGSQDPVNATQDNSSEASVPSGFDLADHPDSEPSTSPAKATSTGTEAADINNTKDDKKDGDQAPAQASTTLESGTKTTKRYNLNKITNAAEPSQGKVPTEATAPEDVEFDGHMFKLSIKPPRPFPGNITNRRHQEAWDRMSCIDETHKDLKHQAKTFKVPVMSKPGASDLATKLFKKIANYEGKDSAATSMSEFADNVTGNRHVKAQLYKNYLTGQARLDALRALRLPADHNALKELSDADRDYVTQSVMGPAATSNGDSATAPKPAKRARSTAAPDSSSEQQPRKKRTPAAKPNKLPFGLAANNTTSATYAVGQYSEFRLEPQGPGVNGLELIRLISANWPGAHIGRPDNNIGGEELATRLRAAVVPASDGSLDHALFSLMRTVEPYGTRIPGRTQLNIGGFSIPILFGHLTAPSVDTRNVPFVSLITMLRAASASAGPNEERSLTRVYSKMFHSYPDPRPQGGMHG